MVRCPCPRDNECPPDCYSYFMDKSKECSQCKYLKECYKAWKENNEPTRIEKIKVKVQEEYRLSCKECS